MQHAIWFSLSVWEDQVLYIKFFKNLMALARLMYLGR